MTFLKLAKKVEYFASVLSKQFQCVSKFCD